MIELLDRDTYVNQQKRKSCTSQGASSSAVLLRCCTFIPQTQSHIADSELKERLPMKDFLPVFMSPPKCLIISGTESLMNERLSAAEVIECIREMWSSCKYASLSFSVSFFQWLSLQLWSEKSFKSQANNFPRCTSLFPLLLLPHITLPACAETK